MNYIVSKSDTRYEYRIYINNDEEIEGTVIYKGHKLGVENSLLSEILNYKIEKISGKIFYFDYNINETSSSIKSLLDSWQTIITKIKTKISVSKVNI